MIAIEKHLINKGWQMMVYKDGKLEPAQRHFISTMGNLDHRYIKDGFEVIIGLHEWSKPLTLISPRPYGWTDDDMNRFLTVTPVSAVYDFILEGLEARKRITN